MLTNNQDNKHKHKAKQINTEGPFTNFPSSDLETVLHSIDGLLMYAAKNVMISANDGNPLSDVNGEFVFATK